MAFYVWDTPEVAKHFKSKFCSNQLYVVSNHDYLIKIDMMLPGSSALLNLLKSEGIPEYKLHYKHGLIPANSKLFKEDIDKTLNKEDTFESLEKIGRCPSDKVKAALKEVADIEKNFMSCGQKGTKKVFEVGDKCIIKNVDNKFSVSDDVYENFVDKEVTVVAKFTISHNLVDSDIDMVSVMNEFGYCACFPESTCYPVKSEKEKAIEEIVEVVCSQGFLAKDGTVSWDIADKLYKAGYRKVKV